MTKQNKNKNKNKNKKIKGSGFEENNNNENPLEFYQRQKRIKDNHEQINKLFQQMQEERKINDIQQNDINYNKNRLKEITEKLKIETNKPHNTNLLEKIKKGLISTYNLGKQIKPATTLLNLYPNLQNKAYIGAVLKGAKAIGLGKHKRKFKNINEKMQYIRSFKK